METVADFIFLGSKITDGDCSHEIKRCLLLARNVMASLDSILKNRHYFANKGPSSQDYVFSTNVCMWELDYKESWVPKNWCFWTVMWIFIGKTDAETETPILWSPVAKNWLIGKDLYSGKDWGWEEKWMTEGEMVGWHQPLDIHEYILDIQALGVDDWQGSLACYSPWGRKESDITEQLNLTNHPSMTSWPYIQRK